MNHCCRNPSPPLDGCGGDPDWANKCYYIAGYFGHTAVVEWLIVNQYHGSPSLDVFSGATKSGNLKTLRWLKQNDYTWCNEFSCFEALHKGNLDTLKWFREQGCAWGFKMGRNSTLYVTEAGQWARANGCPVRR